MFRQFVSSKKGNFSLTLSVLAVPVMLAVGMAVDYGNMNRIRISLQSALDAASMQIALIASTGISDDKLETFGNQVLVANLNDRVTNSQLPPRLRYYGITTLSDGSLVLSTSARYDYPLMFMGSTIFGNEKTKRIGVRAKIRVRPGDPACVYALNPSIKRAVDVSGSTNVTMDGCIIAANSNDLESIYVGGSAKIGADCAQTAGQIKATSGFKLKCPAPIENAWKVTDPLKDVAEPARPASLTANPNKNATSVNPGRYSNLSLDGTKTLKPGVYYVEGSLDIKGTITGTGVTIFMKNGSVSVNGAASLKLSSPTSGAYAGILFMAARDNANPMAFNGSGVTELNGFIYSLKGQVTYAGNNSTTSTCLRIVADTVKLTGSSTMKSDCSALLGGRVARASGPIYFSM